MEIRFSYLRVEEISVCPSVVGNRGRVLVEERVIQVDLARVVAVREERVDVDHEHGVFLEQKRKDLSH